MPLPLPDLDLIGSSLLLSMGKLQLYLAYLPQAGQAVLL